MPIDGTVIHHTEIRGTFVDISIVIASFNTVAIDDIGLVWSRCLSDSLFQSVWRCIEVATVQEVDPFALGMADALIHGIRHNLLRIVKNAQIGALGLVGVNNIPRPIVTHSIHKQYL